MARKIKGYTKSKRHSAFTNRMIALGVEVGLVLSSLFWAVDGIAFDHSKSPNRKKDRALASMAPLKSLKDRGDRQSAILESGSIQHTSHSKKQNSRLEFGVAMPATTFVSSGEGLSFSFRTSPYYSPTMLELFRFKTFIK